MYQGDSVRFRRLNFEYCGHLRGNMLVTTVPYRGHHSVLQIWLQLARLCLPWAWCPVVLVASSF